MKKLPAALFCALAGAAHAAPCDSPEARQFDFWVGDWDLSYVQEGKRLHSRNRITKGFGGCVVLEEFTGKPGIELEGRSVSVYDRGAKRWKQTWVDNEGSYLDFTGGWQDGRMVLQREAERDGKRFLQRMVFEDIRADALKWLWQRSPDGGATWVTQWEIEYRRVK